MLSMSTSCKMAARAVVRMSWAERSRALPIAIVKAATRFLVNSSAIWDFEVVHHTCPPMVGDKSPLHSYERGRTGVCHRREQRGDRTGSVKQYQRDYLCFPGCTRWISLYRRHPGDDV